MADINKKGILKSELNKVKLVDAGVKNKYNTLSDCAVPCKTSEDKIYYPSMYLSSKEAPMLIGTDVGSEITMLVKAKVTSHSLRERANEEKCEDFNLEVHQIGVVETKNSKE